MKYVYMVITDCGDGSQYVEWVTDEAVLTRMRGLADEGDEKYSSGDGLQENLLKFPDDFDIDQWFSVNRITPTTLEDISEGGHE